MIVTCKATVTLEIYLFKKRYINIQYNKKQIQTFPIVNHK